ncbi:hypothetical protein HanIR_Chr06g0275401 [Helianthus annuus]|nr:hypothetical protein HanIR_Chr06g0275401 [Helianthus annuus]
MKYQLEIFVFRPWTFSCCSMVLPHLPSLSIWFLSLEFEAILVLQLASELEVSFGGYL